MRKAIVEVIVQVPDDVPEDHVLFSAMNQMEQYLNTGRRCVDFNIRLLTEHEEKLGVSLLIKEKDLPVPAAVLVKEE